MGIRDLGGGRAVHLPVIDDELGAGELDGELELQGVRLEGGEHGGLVGEGTIEGSVLNGVDLSAAKLNPLTLSDTRLRQVDLSNASLQQVVARRTELRSCRAIGVRLSLDLAADLSIVDCRLDYASIHVEKVKGIAVFERCSFREATISGDLSNTIFLDCDFASTEFRVRKATRCDLRTSRLNDARGLLTLKGATISTEQVVGASAMIASEAGLIVAD